MRWQDAQEAAGSVRWHEASKPAAHEAGSQRMKQAASMPAAYGASKPAAYKPSSQRMQQASSMQAVTYFIWLLPLYTDTGLHAHPATHKLLQLAPRGAPCTQMPDCMRTCCPDSWLALSTDAWLHTDAGACQGLLLAPVASTYLRTLNTDA